MSLLAALLRHQYPGAQIEEFPTAHGEGVGIRRSGELPPSRPGFPAPSPSGLGPASLRDWCRSPKPGCSARSPVFCFSPDDIDVATVFTATIAHRMTVVRGSGR
jgi:hypothetical protein